MRIILSRKGFDSSLQGGGNPNIIYNNTPYMIPIPEEGTGIKYADLPFEETNYLEVMRDLNINQFTECHLDPFISKDIRPLQCNLWKFNLGQVDKAQSSLDNIEPPVREGDLFLFFGWFKKVEKGTKGYKYIPLKNYHPDGVHLIYGYLYVGKKTAIQKHKKRPDWTDNHPHILHQDFYDKKYLNNNTLYVAKEQFKNTGLPGAGVFTFSEALILSKRKHVDKNNSPIVYTRTIWELPSAFLGAKIKLLNKSQPLENTTIKAASRGQEFVVLDDPDKKISLWAEKLITTYLKK